MHFQKHFKIKYLPYLKKAVYANYLKATKLIRNYSIKNISKINVNLIV